VPPVIAGDGFSGGIGGSDGPRLLCHECISGGVEDDGGVVDAACDMCGGVVTGRRGS